MDSGEYPAAIDPQKVGNYPALAKSGGGYFWDEVLEYRVWVHPERGGPNLFEDEDYYRGFVTFDAALAFSGTTSGAEEPLVLVRQWEWVDEPEPGVYRHMKQERVTEWRVEWLKGSKREEGAVARFLAERRSGA